MKLVFLVCILYVIQFYFPPIYIFNTTLSVDIILLFLTVYGIKNKRIYCIFLGFLTGLIQDLNTQINLVGAFSIAKTISGYAFGTIYNYEKIWSKHLKFIFIFMVYILHNSIYYYLKLFSLIEFSLIIQLILLQSIISIIILQIVNIFFYNNKLIK